MTGPLQILIVGADPQLGEECESALASLGGEAPVFHRAADSRQAVEIARSRRPGLAIVEMGVDLARLKAIVSDIAAVSPETLTAAAFRPEVFGHDVSESELLIEALRSGVRDFLRRPSRPLIWGSLSSDCGGKDRPDPPAGEKLSLSSATRAGSANRHWPSTRRRHWPYAFRSACCSSTRRCRWECARRCSTWSPR